MQHYPLPPNYLGEEYVVVLEHIVAGTALAFPQLSAGPVAIPVTVEPDNLSRGWRIRCAQGYLGWLDAQESADFPDLERIRNAQMHVSTWATLELDDAALEVAVHLGPGSWQIARNDLPAGALLFATGLGAPVDTSVSRDIDSGQLGQMEACQFFVTVQLADQTVVVSVDDGRTDAVLGTINAPDFVIELLTQAASQQVVVGARAYSAAGLIAVDLPCDPAAAFTTPVPPLGAPSLPVIPAPTRPEELRTYYFAAAEVCLPAPTGKRAFIAADDSALQRFQLSPAERTKATAAGGSASDQTSATLPSPDNRGPVVSVGELFGDADAAAESAVAAAAAAIREAGAQNVVWAPWPTAAGNYASTLPKEQGKRADTESGPRHGK